MNQSLRLKRFAGVGLVLAGAALGLAFGSLRNSDAEEIAARKTAGSSLQIVSYGTGMTGIFDPETLRIYLYDSNLVNCVAIREIEALGEPMKRIKG